MFPEWRRLRSVTDLSDPWSPPMRISVLPNGRLVLPVHMRRQLGIERGGQIVAEIEGDVVRLTTADRSLDEARALFASYVTTPVSIADEVIAERRAEAASEAGSDLPDRTG